MTGRHCRLAMASGLAASMVSITSAPVLAVEPQGTERVSVHTDGTQGNLDSFDAAVSADGRYVAFDSESMNLVAGDTNAKFDVFVHDRDTGATERISVHSDGTQGNSESFSRAISADGRYVVFDSAATNLVPGDTNAEHDVFVHDRDTGTTERISVRSNGAQGNGHSSAGAVSADGRFVAFHSLATNLIDGDTNAERDVFVHDRATGATQRVSIASDGAQSDANSGEPAMSADGRLVAFQSEASNLVAGDTNGVFDIFVHDRATGATERVSVGSDGAQGDGLSLNAATSADGRFVAFDSAATNLVTGDTNALFDVFLHDRWTGATERVSIAGD
ncbi:MAG TPA: hypothetical protein VML96_10150, partial [Egibacteraceae bacterium]|nr:hypothetical protein [Egibacteraceae bacterium]